MLVQESKDCKRQTIYIYPIIKHCGSTNTYTYLVITYYMNYLQPKMFLLCSIFISMFVYSFLLEIKIVLQVSQLSSVTIHSPKLSSLTPQYSVQYQQFNIITISVQIHFFQFASFSNIYSNFRVCLLPSPLFFPPLHFFYFLHYVYK